MYKIITLFFFTALYSQTIYHEPIKFVDEEVAIKIDVFTDLQGQELLNYNLFYRKKNQVGFFQKKMETIDGVYYFANIPSELIIDDYIEYYISLETSSNIVSIPEMNPQLKPLLINISQKSIGDKSIVINNKFNIISPLPNEKIMSKDLVISLSYFQLDDLDLQSIKIFLDNKDVTKQARVKPNHLILNPKRLSNGNHSITISMKDRFGNNYEPVTWNFVIISNKYKESFDFSGRLYSDYFNSGVDESENEYNSTNFNFLGKTEWMDFKLNLKHSSLENKLFQPYNRYNIELINRFININYGDFYPQFDQFVLNGNKVRGLGFNFRTKFFQLYYIDGQLNRAIQGNARNIYSTSNSIAVNDITGQSYNELSISRVDYTFENELNALRIGVGNPDKINFGLNIAKVKDIPNSVEVDINDAIVDFSTEEFNDFNSDQFVDINSNGEYDINIDILYLDFNSNGQFDDAELYSSNFSNFISYSKDAIIIDDAYEYNGDNYSIIQFIWSLTTENRLIDKIIEQNFNNEITVNYLDDNWDGDKPKDNLVIGTDFKLNYTKVSFNSNLALSLVNENIWNPIKTLDEFDTYTDEYEDCYYGRTYINDFPSNYYWENCIAYKANGNQINLIIDEPGISISEIPNPEELEEIFHYNFDSVPVVPFYDIMKKKENNEDVSFSDILDLPEIAYDLNVQLNYPKQNIRFGYKKIGSSFYSLANPYLQNDKKEEYFGNTLKFFNNRIFFTINWRSIKTGLLDKNNASVYDKYDINMNIYPNINFPSITLNYGLYTKESGELLSYDNSGNTELIDTRLNTRTENYNIYLSYDPTIFHKQHNINLSFYESEKKDLLINEIISDNYISPRSSNKNYNLSLKSYLDEYWSTDIYFSNSYFDFAQTDSEFYQEQDIVIYRFGFSYKNNRIINNIGTWYDFSKGEGSTEYTQYGIKLLMNLKLYENLNLELYLRGFNKKTNINSEINQSSNSVIRANLSYRF